MNNTTVETVEPHWFVAILMLPCHLSLIIVGTRLSLWPLWRLLARGRSEARRNLRTYSPEINLLLTGTAMFLLILPLNTLVVLCHMMKQHLSMLCHTWLFLRRLTDALFMLTMPLVTVGRLKNMLVFTKPMKKKGFSVYHLLLILIWVAVLSLVGYITSLSKNTPYKDPIFQLCTHEFLVSDEPADVTYYILRYTFPIMAILGYLLTGGFYLAMIIILRKKLRKTLPNAAPCDGDRPNFSRNRFDSYFSPSLRSAMTSARSSDAPQKNSIELQSITSQYSRDVTTTDQEGACQSESASSKPRVPLTINRVNSDTKLEVPKTPPAPRLKRRPSRKKSRKFSRPRPLRKSKSKPPMARTESLETNSVSATSGPSTMERWTNDNDLKLEDLEKTGAGFERQESITTIARSVSLEIDRTGSSAEEDPKVLSWPELREAPESPIDREKSPSCIPSVAAPTLEASVRKRSAGSCNSAPLEQTTSQGEGTQEATSSSNRNAKLPNHVMQECTDSCQASSEGSQFSKLWQVRKRDYRMSCPPIALQSSVAAFNKEKESSQCNSSQQSLDSKSSLEWMRLPKRKQLPPILAKNAVLPQTVDCCIQTDGAVGEASTSMQYDDTENKTSPVKRKTSKRQPNKKRRKLKKKRVSVGKHAIQSPLESCKSEIPRVKVIRPSTDSQTKAKPVQRPPPLQSHLSMISEGNTSVCSSLTSGVNSPVRNNQTPEKTNFMSKALRITTVFLGTFVLCFAPQIFLHCFVTFIPRAWLVNLHLVFSAMEYMFYALSPLLLLRHLHAHIKERKRERQQAQQAERQAPR